MGISDYDSYQGNAIAVANTEVHGIVRLLKCDIGTKYVVHTNVDPESGDGMNGHYFDDLKQACDKFISYVSENTLMTNS